MNGLIESYLKYAQLIHAVFIKALIVVFDVGSSNVACPIEALLVKDNGEISLCTLFLTEYSGETCDKDDDGVFLFVYEVDFVGEKTCWGFIF